MSYTITDRDRLLIHEALRVEGDKNSIDAYCRQHSTADSAKLKNGEQLLLSYSPSIPLLTRTWIAGNTWAYHYNKRATVPRSQADVIIARLTKPAGRRPRPQRNLFLEKWGFDIPDRQLSQPVGFLREQIREVQKEELAQKQVEARKLFNNGHKKTPAKPEKNSNFRVYLRRYALKQENEECLPLKVRSTPLFSDLNSRQYTIKALRTGWVYVYSAETGLVEYRVQDEKLQLTERAPTDIQLYQEQALLLDNTYKLNAAYSEVQWTDRVYQTMQEDSEVRAACMPSVDLTGMIAITPRLESKDIHFDDENTANALFFALDDPMDDLRELQSSYVEAMLPVIHDQDAEALKKSETDLAKVIRTICSLPDDGSHLPDKCRGNTELTAQFYEDFSKFYKLKSECDHLILFIEQQEKETYTDIEPYKLKLGKLNKDQEYLLKNMDIHYGYEADYVLPETGKTRIDSDYLEWKTKTRWREEVNFTKVLASANYTYTPLIDRAKADHIVALARLDLQNALTQFDYNLFKGGYDNQNIKQLFQLFLFNLGLVTILYQNDSEESQEWLYKELDDPKTLVGSFLYGFERELAEAMKATVLDKIFRTAGDPTNAAGRAADTQGVISNETVRNTEWFKKLSSAAQTVFNTLTEAVSGPAGAAYTALFNLIIPTVAKITYSNPNTAQFLLPAALFNATGEKIRLNQDFKADYEQFKKKHTQLVAERAAIRRKPKSKHHGAKINTLTKEIDKLNSEYPQFVFFENKKTKVSSSLKDISKNLDNIDIGEWVGAHGGGLNLLVVVLNIVNLGVLLRDTADSSDGAPDPIQLTYYLAYIVNPALTSFYLASAQAALKEAAGGSLALQTKDPVLIKSANFWESDDALTGNITREVAKQNAQTIKSFGFRSAVTGAFGLLAVGFEVIYIVKNPAASEPEKYLQYGQIAGLFVQGVGFGGQAYLGYNVSRGSLTAGKLLHPWIPVVMAIGGLIYMVSSFILNYIKKDALQLWLRSTPWGREPTSDFTAEGLQKALLDFQKMAYQPVITTKKVKVTENLENFRTQEERIRYAQSLHGASLNDPKGYWLYIALPNALKDVPISIKVMNIGDKLTPQEDIDALVCTGNWTVNENACIYKTYIAASRNTTHIEVEVSYPGNVFDIEGTHSYQFKSNLSSNDWITLEQIENTKDGIDPITNKPLNTELLIDQLDDEHFVMLQVGN